MKTLISLLIFLGMLSCKNTGVQKNAGIPIPSPTKPEMFQNAVDTNIIIDCKCPDLYFSSSNVDPVLRFKFLKK